MRTITLQVRSLAWFVTGAMLATMVTLMFANAWRVDASPGDVDTTFVPIEPCRLADTRPAPARVGVSGTLTADDTTTFQATGTVGECAIPTDAVGVSMNVTAVGATAAGNFLTFWPEGERPLASSLNPTPGAPPTPNGVTIPLSSSGSFNVYNFVGTVNIAIDVVGYQTRGSLQELAQRLARAEGDIASMDAAQRASAASPLVTNRSITPSLSAMTSVTLTAPESGTVNVFGSGSFYTFSATANAICGIHDAVAEPPQGALVSWHASLSSAQSGALSANRVFDVSAGETRTFTLMCASSTPVGLDSPTLVALFRPAA